MSQLPLIASESWTSLAELVNILHHPNFYWGGIGDNNTRLKYLEVRIDTRDNSCLIRDRNHKAVSVAELKAALAKPIMAGMNENPQLRLVPIAPPIQTAHRADDP